MTVSPSLFHTGLPASQYRSVSLAEYVVILLKNNHDICADLFSGNGMSNYNSKAQEQLWDAIQAEDRDEKNRYIREALQLLVLRQELDSNSATNVLVIE